MPLSNKGKLVKNQNIQKKLFNIKFNKEKESKTLEIIESRLEDLLEHA